MNYVRWKNLSLKYQRFTPSVTPSGGKNIGIRKSDFVTKTQFLYGNFIKCLCTCLDAKVMSRYDNQVFY